jgi:predicted DNA-binding transcriptional regulator AlpA
VAYEQEDGMSDRIIREPERARMTGISRSAWWEGERAGRYPKRRSIGPSTVGWLESELLAFIRATPAGGPDAPAAAIAARGVHSKREA